MGRMTGRRVRHSFRFGRGLAKSWRQSLARLVCFSKLVMEAFPELLSERLRREFLTFCSAQICQTYRALGGKLVKCSCLDSLTCLGSDCEQNRFDGGQEGITESRHDRKSHESVFLPLLLGFLSESPDLPDQFPPGSLLLGWWAFGRSPHLHSSHKRLHTPMVVSGNSFQRITWNICFGIIAFENVMSVT